MHLSGNADSANIMLLGVQDTIQDTMINAV